MIKYFYPLLILLLCCDEKIYAQSYPLKHFTVDDGLNSNTVYDAIQDNRGFMWFATSAGASRFDGKKFERFTIDNCLSDNEILKIKGDLSGRLWMLMFNGTVTVLENDSLHSGLSHPLLKKLGPGFFFQNIYADSSGNCLLSNFRNVNCRIDFPDTVSFLSSESSVLFSTRAGDIVIHKEKGIVFFFEVLKKIQYPELHQVNRWCYHGDSLFIALTNTAIVTVDKNGEFRFYPVSLPGVNDIIDIYCDSSLGIWITTEKNGVYYFERHENRYRFFDSFLKGEYITSTFRDRESNVWFTVHGNGVYMLPSNFRTTH